MQGVVLSRQPNVKLSLFAEGVALPPIGLFGLTLDDSLNFGKHVRKLARMLKATRVSL